VAGFDWISLCTDYGYADGFVAACHGVIARIAPKVRMLDVTHAIGPGDVRHGSVVLADTLPWLPPAVHVAVVDPGVGTLRRGLALVSGDAVLVGPDNGLLVPAARALGGLRAAYELAEPSYRLPAVSATFHGRDIFAPAAAHLAAGVAFEAFGPAVDPASLVASPIADPIVEPGFLRSSIVYIDTFGNIKLAGLRTDLEAAIGPLTPGDRLELEFDADGDLPTRVEHIHWRTTFGEAQPQEVLLYEDSYGRICLAENQGNAAADLGVSDDRKVAIRRA
jgi:S-adenosyl-L-methionine hydrolase (adenosine-forming)